MNPNSTPKSQRIVIPIKMSASVPPPLPHLGCFNLMIVHDHYCFYVILDSMLLKVLEARLGKYVSNLDCPQFVAGMNKSRQKEEILNHGEASKLLSQTNFALTSDQILEAKKNLLTHERLYVLSCFKFKSRGRRNDREK